MRGFRRNLSMFIFLTLLFIFSTKYIYAFVPIVPDIKLKLDPKIVSCVLIANKYDEKLSKFIDSHNTHIEIYTKLSDRLESLVNKWEDWGYDVDQIRDDMNELDILIEEYKEDYEDLEDKIELAKERCTQDDYAAKLSEAKEALKEVRRDVVDIRVFYQTELRPHIVALKQQEI